MASQAPIRRHIAFLGCAFLGFQVLVLFALCAIYDVALSSFGLFAAVCVAYHALLTGLLAWRSGDFRIDGTDRQLERVNLPNVLTFARLSSIPTVLFMIMLASQRPVLPVALPFICAVFATDFLDGRLARRRHEITFVGRYLDSTSDYLVLVSISILLFYYGLIPLWFFILILTRLVLFSAGMALLALRFGKADPVSTFLGKASIFATMVLYVLEVAEMLRVPWIGDPLVVRIMEYAVAGVIAISFVDKGVFLGRKLKQSSSPTVPGQAS